MSKPKDDLPYELVDLLIQYDPETGKAYRKSRFDGPDRWCQDYNARYAGTEITRCKKGYLILRLSGKEYSLHRLIWLLIYGTYPTDQIDHINGNRADNRKCNLRAATQSQNTWNRVVRGASFNNRRGKWRATMTLNGKEKLLGHFLTKEEAQNAYRQAALEHHGEFVRN